MTGHAFRYFYDETLHEPNSTISPAKQRLLSELLLRVKIFARMLPSQKSVLVKKLQEKKPVLKRLSDSIPWESFRPLLKRGYAHERKSNAGRKRIDPLILFKMLVLQQLFNLSDEELEFQVNDRRSFEEFVGLGVMNSIPDATTVAFFRERLRKAGVIEELIELFEAYLRS